MVCRSCRTLGPLSVARKGKPKMSTHVDAVLHATLVARGSLSMPAVESQSVEGAPRRRAAPGGQSVKVAAEAATSGYRWSIRTTQPSLPERAKPLHLEARCLPVPRQRSGSLPRPCAEAQRLPTSRATASVGASAHARHALVAHCRAYTRPAGFASEHNAHMRGKCSAFLRRAPNPSIERTCLKPLRAFSPAAHVER